MSELDHNWVLFGRSLRQLGFAVTPARISAVLEALEHTGLEHRADVKAAARSLLVSRHEQEPLFDRAFDLFWRAETVRGLPRIEMGRILRRASRQESRFGSALPSDAARGDGEEPELVLEARATYSSTELLRHKDFAELTPGELAAIRRLLRRRVLELPPRRTRRELAAKSGRRPDPRATIRRALRHGGEPLELAWRRRKVKRRPLVVLCDISGSMEAYARIFLELIYTLRTATDRLEAFVFGTRLTRITRQLRHRDIDRALSEAAAQVVDWGGGTRIGESLRRFNVDWGRRVLGQGAVAMVISDGWDRGEVDLLAHEAARLERTSSRLMWLNPLLGSPGYEPLTRGIRAVLPHVDDFLPLYNLHSLEQLGEALRKLGVLGRGRPSRASRFLAQ